jgi:hypothetical protein
METTSFIFDHTYTLKGRNIRDVSDVTKLVADNTDTVVFKIETTGYNNNVPVYTAKFFCPAEDLPIEDKERAIVKKI